MESTFKTGLRQGRRERNTETYSLLTRPPTACRNRRVPRQYVAGIQRLENAAADRFQRARNKKSPRPGTDPEDCTRFFILTCSPALEGAMANSPGRSSGSWFVLLPVPSHPSNGQWRWRVSSPLTAAGPRGIYTLFPYPKIMM